MTFIYNLFFSFTEKIDMFKILLSLFSLLLLVETQAQNNTSNKNTSSLNLEWKSRGPSNLAGITNALLWDKDDENVIYAGGIAGGLFKTTNKGNTWNKVTSFAENNPTISSFAQSINGTIFIGTGNIAGTTPDGSLWNYSFGGDGIYKSNDQGATWTSIIATDEFSFPTFYGEWSNVRCMAAHPTLTNILMVGNNSGVRISINAEDAQPVFFNATGVGSNVSDVKFTSNGQEAWAAAGGRLYHSTDFANNFVSFIQNSPTTGANADIAISGVDGNGDYTIYVSYTNSGGCLMGIYKSEDKGANWTQIAFSGSIDPFEFGYGSCQGWYSHALAVNPDDKDVLYIGGVRFATITSQGDLILIDDVINEAASDFLAADKHDIVFNPFNSNEMMIATDLGVYFSSNALSGHPYNISYTSKNFKLNNSNTLNAGFGKNGDILISGIQNTHYLDYSNINTPYNASKIWNSSNASAEISNYEESVFLFSGYYGSLKKSINFGNTNFPFLDTIIDPANCDQITCVQLSPGYNCDAIYGSGVNFISENFFYESASKAKYFAPSKCGKKFFVCTNPLSLTEAPIYNSFAIPLQSGIQAMDISSDGDRLVFGTGSRFGIIEGFDAFIPSIPNDINTNTAQVDTFYINLNTIGINMISGISIDKNNKDHIIVVEDGYGSSSKVAKSLDGGITWNLIHNNLPEIPVFDCIIDENNSNNYILATLEGIYTSNDAGATWNADNSGMGKLPIYRIKQEWVLEEDCFVLLAATIGNGVYTSTTLTSCNKNVEEEIWGAFTPISEINKPDLKLKVYPNPAQNKFQIEIETSQKETNDVKIFDVFGKQIFQSTIKNALEVETTNWSSGMYFIAIGNSFTKIIVK